VPQAPDTTDGCAAAAEFGGLGATARTASAEVAMKALFFGIDRCVGNWAVFGLGPFVRAPEHDQLKESL